MNQQGKEKVIVGMEPTGHYWLNLAHFFKEQHINFVVVNPLHVKKSKELDDNSPTKNDVKDARVIVQLVKDGRYAVPNIPHGVYAELRVAIKIRDLLTFDLQAVQGQIHNWLDRFFPEFLTVFKDWEGKSALQLLKLNLLPYELSKLTDQKILMHLRKVVTRAVGLSKITELKEVASHSIGIREGSAMAKLELRTLIDKYELINEKFEELTSNIDDLQLVLDTVEQLNDERDVQKATLHSDQGFQYTSRQYNKRIKELGISGSYSRQGNCLDNACIESFFSHLKTKTLYVTECKTEDDLFQAIEKYIWFYNHERFQKKLNQCAPVEYTNTLAA